MKRNHGKLTPSEVLEGRILRALGHYAPDKFQAVNSSSLGYAAYQGYDFKNPQGSALAVGRHLRHLHDQRLIRPALSARGWTITHAGREKYKDYYQDVVEDYEKL